MLKVANWHPGDLGIALSQGSPTLTPGMTYNGDQRAPLIGIEIDPDIPSTDWRYNTYKWSAVTWAADGTLTNGVAEANFNDVITGSAQADQINGLGGNDALDGGGAISPFFTLLKFKSKPDSAPGCVKGNDNFFVSRLAVANDATRKYGHS